MITPRTPFALALPSARAMRLVLAGAAAATLAIVTQPLAAPACPGPGARAGTHAGVHRQQCGIEDRLLALDLDDATRAAVFAILDGSRSNTRELRADVRSAHEEMKRLLEQDPPSEAAVLAQADALGAHMSALRRQQLSTMLAVRALLTPEQAAGLRLTGTGRDRPGCSERWATTRLARGVRR